MIDTDKYEGHTPVWYLHGETGAWWVQSDFTTHDDFVVAEVRSQNEVDAQLIADAPLLLAEVKRLYEMNEKMRNEIHVALDNERMRNGANGGWLRALEYVLALMDVQEEEE